MVYNSALAAAPEVARRRLCDMEGVETTPDTSTTMLVLDTSACANSRESSSEVGATSLVNEGEARLAAAHVASLVRAGVDPEGIAVITPYAAQVEAIHEALAAEGASLGETVEVSTADGWQGREADAVVISAVR